MRGIAVAGRRRAWTSATRPTTAPRATIIQYALIALLVAAALKNYLRRETIEPPKWLGKLQEAGPKQAPARPACS